MKLNSRFLSVPQIKLKKECIKSFCYVIGNTDKGQTKHWLWNEKGQQIQGRQWKTPEQS